MVSDVDVFHTRIKDASSIKIMAPFAASCNILGFASRDSLLLACTPCDEYTAGSAITTDRTSSVWATYEIAVSVAEEAFGVFTIKYEVQLTGFFKVVYHTLSSQ